VSVYVAVHTSGSPSVKDIAEAGALALRMGAKPDQSPTVGSSPATGLTIVVPTPAEEDAILESSPVEPERTLFGIRLTSLPLKLDGLEVIPCDNASSDGTPMLYLRCIHCQRDMDGAPSATVHGLLALALQHADSEDHRRAAGQPEADAPGSR
jgi:hypothetical protein